MKTFGLNSITTFLTLMVLFNLVNTPAVKTGPASFASCMLGCCGTVCKGVAIACKFYMPLATFTGISSEHYKREWERVYFEQTRFEKLSSKARTKVVFLT